MIQGLWDVQVKSIIEVKLGGADADYYKYEPMEALLYWWETIKKYKHSKHCNYQQIFFTICYFSGWNDRQGSPGLTCVIESNHGREKGRTHFTCTGVDNLFNCNRGCDILLTYDPRSSTPQYPAGQGSGLGSGTRNWAGRLNHTSV